MSDDVDLDRLASISHGFVGADLEALCREAAMICLRRILPEIDFASAQIPYDTLGKLEVHMGDFQQALQEVEPSAIREVFVELPDVHWGDVGGLDDRQKQLIESVEWPLKYSSLFTAAGVTPPKGILLSGPPGCGKTLLAKAVANESQVNFISVKGPALISKYVGESEKGVREIFRKAKQAAPCIVFFDEIDSLLPARSEGGRTSHVSERVLSQFLTEMDGVEELRGVLVLGATNRPDLLDPALLRPGRFDVQVTIDLPNLDGRKHPANWTAEKARGSGCFGGRIGDHHGWFQWSGSSSRLPTRRPAYGSRGHCIGRNGRPRRGGRNHATSSGSGVKEVRSNQRDE